MKRAGDGENNFSTPPPKFVPVMMPLDGTDFYGGQWGAWHGPPGPRGMPHMRGFHPRGGQMRFFIPGPNRGRPPGPHGFNNYNNYHGDPGHFGFQGGIPGDPGHHGFQGAQRRPWVHMRPPPPVTQLITVPVPVQQADQWGGYAPIHRPSALKGAGEKKNVASPAQGQQPARKPWNLEAAQKALEAEQEYHKTFRLSIMIRFPDPELSKEIVKRLHPSIDTVHFQVPSGSRYCFAHLVDDAKIDKTISEIEKIPFGNGTLKVEKKVDKEEVPTTPQSLDPFTLYLGNLPTTITSSAVKEQFPKAYRVDIGYAQKMKFTRYAFIRFLEAEDALQAYKNSVNVTIQNRSIILRFRRHQGPVGMRGEVVKQEMNTISEKLTVGAKMKAKKEKIKAEREAKGEIVEDEDSDIGEDEDISDDDDCIDDEYLEKHIKFENDDVESEDEDKDEDDDEDDDVQCNIVKEPEEFDNTDDIFNGLGDCDWTNITEAKPGQ